MDTVLQPYQILERAYADYVGTQYGVSVNTGTAALHLALRALDIGEGDEVIIPEFTMIACAWAVTYTGAKPVFVDCREDLLIDPEKIEEKITERTKAIMPVHIYGRVCDMDWITEIAKKHNLRIIEDCCEAQGAYWRNKPVGSYDIGVFSFYINKIIPAQEGGFITTNDEKLYNRMQFLKNMSFGNDHDYLHTMIGFNYRMPNAMANMALASLASANSFIVRRRNIDEWYATYLNPLYVSPYHDVVWVFDIYHPKAPELVKWLNEQGIGARNAFKPMSMQPMYYDENYKNLKAYEMSQKICYLPVNPLMSEEIVKKICEKIDLFDSQVV